MLKRYLPAAYLLRSGFRAGVAGLVWLAGYEHTAHILAVFATMSLLGPIEINAAKDAVAWWTARSKKDPAT